MHIALVSANVFPSIHNIPFSTSNPNRPWVGCHVFHIKLSIDVAREQGCFIVVHWYVEYFCTRSNCCVLYGCKVYFMLLKYCKFYFITIIVLNLYMLKAVGTDIFVSVVPPRMVSQG